jgi:hypothetical protein
MNINLGYRIDVNTGSVVRGLPIEIIEENGDDDMTVTVGTVSELPESGNSGDMFFPTDGIYTYVHDGDEWKTWAFGFPMTPPVLTDFTWDNQGTGTANDNNGAIFLSAPALAGNNCRVLYKSAPSTPYTLTAAFIPVIINSQNYQKCGVGWRQSSDGKMVIAQYERDSSWLRKHDNATSESSNYQQVNHHEYGFGGPTWVKLEDDGTNRKVYWGLDGTNWVLWHSHDRTNHMTANQLCFMASADNENWGSAMILLHWKEE